MKKLLIPRWLVTWSIAISLLSGAQSIWLFTIFNRPMERINLTAIFVLSIVTAIAMFRSVPNNNKRKNNHAK